MSASPPAPTAPSFVFAVVRPGSEPFAKAEALAAHPHLRLSYARPGLLTFKDPTGAAGEAFGAGLVFPRVSGRSLGLAEGAAAILERVPEGPRALHVFPRSMDDRPEVAEAALAACLALEAELRALGGPRFAASGPLADGAPVLDVVVAAGEPALVGLHRHGPGRWPVPGGLVRAAERPGSPSRASRKLDEALSWSGLDVRPGDVALELGAAPGGMTLALLSRGASVLAVDPAAMSEDVLGAVGPSGARATHLAVAAGALRVETLPPTLDWIVVDLNLAPPVALRYLARVARARPPRRGAIVTLKLNDAEMAARIPEHLDRIRGMGIGQVRATQLPSNRSEITAVVTAPS